MQDSQLIGMRVGAAVGFLVAVGLTGGSYEYLGPWVLYHEGDFGCLGELIADIILVAVGMGVGYLIGSAI